MCPYVTLKIQINKYIVTFPLGHPMGTYGHLLATTDSKKKYLWIHLNIYRHPTDIYGHLQKHMDIYGYLRRTTNTYGHLWTPMGN